MLTLPVWLAACDPGSGIYAFREGATVTQQQEAVFACEVASAKEVPANT